jgi:hypothetical protein
MVFWDVMAIATKDWDSDWLISLGRKMSVKGTESNAMELRLKKVLGHGWEQILGHQASSMVTRVWKRLSATSTIC